MCSTVRYQKQNHKQKENVKLTKTIKWAIKRRKCEKNLKKKNSMERAKFVDEIWINGWKNGLLIQWFTKFKSHVGSFGIFIFSLLSILLHHVEFNRSVFVGNFLLPKMWFKSFASAFRWFLISCGNIVDTVGLWQLNLLIFLGSNSLCFNMRPLSLISYVR